MADHLSLFSSGQVTIDVGTITQIAKDLDGMEVSVTDSLCWVEPLCVAVMHEGKKAKLIKSTNNGISFEISSEHVVIFCKLSFDSCTIPVVVKFHIDRNSIGGSRVFTMSKDHCASIISNYNKMNYHLTAAKQISSFPQVHVVPVCIVKTLSGVNLWIEREVASFRKWWKTTATEKVDMIACTDNKLLQQLQDFIFARSGNQYTVCDLQGSYCTFSDYGNDAIYMLCDIEFTNTMGKMGWRSVDLLACYRKNAENLKAEDKQRKLVPKSGSWCSIL